MGDYMKQNKVKEMAGIQQSAELNKIYGEIEDVRFPVRLDSRLCADKVVTMERLIRHQNVIPFEADDGEIWNTNISSLTKIQNKIYTGKVEESIGLVSFAKGIENQIAVWKKKNSLLTLKTEIHLAFCSHIKNYVIYVQIWPSKAYGGEHLLGKEYYDKFEAFIRSLPDYQSQDDLIAYRQ